MKKFSLTILLITFIFLSFGVSSAYAEVTCSVKASCGSGEVALLEMSNTTNAHAAVPGTGLPYTNSLCCTGGAGLSNSCSGNRSEVIVKLSGNSNAHIRAGSEDNYPGGVDACLSVTSGSLNVSYRTDCNGHGTAIASMSKYLTNAHIGGPNDYENKICVKYTAPSSSGGYIKDFASYLGGFFGIKKISTEKDVAIINDTPIENKTNTNFTNIKDLKTGIPANNTVVADLINDKPVLTAESVHFESDIKQDLSQIVTPVSEVVSDLEVNKTQTAAVDFSQKNTNVNSAIPVILSGIAIVGLVFAGRKLFLRN